MTSDHSSKFNIFGLILFHVWGILCFSELKEKKFRATNFSKYNFFHISDVQRSFKIQHVFRSHRSMKRKVREHVVLVNLKSQAQNKFMEFMFYTYKTVAKNANTLANECLAITLSPMFTFFAQFCVERIRSWSIWCLIQMFTQMQLLVVFNLTIEMPLIHYNKCLWFITTNKMFETNLFQEDT